MVASASDFQMCLNVFSLVRHFRSAERLFMDHIPIIESSAPLLTHSTPAPTCTRNAPGKYLEKLLYPKMIQEGYSYFAMGNILIPYFYFQITKKLTYMNSTWKLTHKHITHIHFDLRKKESQNICETVQVQSLKNASVFKTVRIKLRLNTSYITIQFPRLQRLQMI